MTARTHNTFYRWLVVVAISAATAGCKNPDDGTKPFVFPAYPVRNLSAPKADPPRPRPLEPRRLTPPELPKSLSPPPAEPATRPDR